MAYYVLRYTLAEDYLVAREPYRPEHLSLLQAASARGDLRLAGAHGNTPASTLVRQVDDPAVIADTFGVHRATLYRQLHAYKDGGDCALIVYRNTSTLKIDQNTNRRYGETGASEATQLEADRSGSRSRPRADRTCARSCTSPTVPSPGSAPSTRPAHGATTLTVPATPRSPSADR